MSYPLNLTASEARKNLYGLIEAAAKGLKTFEIKLRGADPVVLISKAELESWQETLDILSSTEETKAVQQAKKQKTLIGQKQMLKSLGLS